MPYITLENDKLKVTISSFGAEMQSLFGKADATEYLWQGNPKFWGRRAPHLFPIIGGLKDGRFVYDSRSYEMGNHGFARDSEFAVEALSKTKAVFTLCERKENYPFDYLLSITYALKRNRLKITYTVKNTGKRKLYFSVGGHPAFACPINPALKYSDYFIEFEKEENPEQPLIQNDLVDGHRILPIRNRRISLLNSLFTRDALVIERPNSKKFRLRSAKDGRQIEMKIKNFDFMAFWSKPADGADFICFEPWCGIDDKADGIRSLESKWKIHCLKPGKTFRCAYSITAT